jgi:hypothetical protein
MASGRLQRLQQRIGQSVSQLASLSEGEILALSWACEMSALVQAAKAAENRVLWTDFDRFLISPTTVLAAALRQFELETSSDTVTRILAGPDMQRYSKAPEHAYDAQLRSEVLNHARAMHGNEIGRGLAWLDRAAAQFGPVHEALDIAYNPAQQVFRE